MSLGGKTYKAVLVGTIIVSLLCASFVLRALNRDREKYGLTRVAPLDNAPPVLAFTTVALGGFRGLIANALWIRANDLQEQDKYFEMFQLSDWITKLEPHFVHVWLVQAWNMAYNISVKFPAAQDRWRWVRGGIELLRDKGLHYNPGETLIYRELAWFFQHKMGQNLDDAHNYYKEAWANEMHEVFGRKNVNFDELIQPTTEDQKNRARILREKYKMDPQLMKNLDAEYGPLEWRLPEAHAIYWAKLGLAKAKREDLITLRRVIYQSMQLAFFRGRLIFDYFMLQPNLEITEKANASYEEMIQQDPEMRDNIQNAHKNFLRNVPQLMYLNNRQAEANRWFAYLKEKYPGSVPAGMTVDEYAMEQISEDMGDTNRDKTTGVVRGLLLQAYFELLVDEDERAANYEKLAQRVWNRYTEKIGDQTKRIPLDPMPRLKQSVVDYLLNPEGNVLQPEVANRLRTKLKLPAGTNAPAASPGAPENK